MKKFYPLSSLKGFRLHTALLTFLLILIQSLYAQTYDLEGNDAVRCGAGELTLTVTWSDEDLNPDNVKWYTVPFYGTPIGTGLTLNTGYIEFTQTYYVDYIGDGGCSQCDRLLIRAVIADQVITPQVIYPSLVFCNSANQNFVPTVVGANDGTFSISPSVGDGSFNTSTGAFNPSALTAGTYVVTFQPEAVIGCNSNPVTVNLTVTNAPVQPVISYAEESYCSSSSTVSVSQTGAGGGSYSASPSGLTINSASGLITPSTSQTGSYTVTYLVPGGGGCAPVSASTTVSILKLPTASISYPAASFTQNQAAQNVTLTGTDDFTGGTYSAPEGLTINTSTGEITPSTSDAGSYTVTYTKANVSPCAGNLTATATVGIFGLPSAGINVEGQPVCIEGDNPVVTFTGSGGATPYTFVYSINEGAAFDISTNGDANTVTLNHPTLVEGSFTYKVLSVSDGNSSSFAYVPGDEPSISITVTTPQVASFEYSGTPYCSNGTDPEPTFLGGGVAGTFSSTEGLVFGNDDTGIIDLSASTAGTYVVTNTIDATGGCSVITANTSVTITKLPDASFTYAPSYCLNSDDPTPVITGDEGGVFSASPAGLIINATTGEIDLSNSTPATYTTTYTITAADGCATVSEEDVVEILSIPTANAGNNAGICLGQSHQIGVAQIDGSTYSWVSDPGSFTSTDAQPIVSPEVTTTYTVTESNGSCSNTGSVTIFILSVPNANPIIGATALCAGSSTIYTSTTYEETSNYEWSYSGTGATISEQIIEDNKVKVEIEFSNNATSGTLSLTETANCTTINTMFIAVNPLPSNPTAGDINVVYDGELKTGTATSSVLTINQTTGASTGSVSATINWYDALTNGNATVAPNGTNVGTYTAYAEAVSPNYGCKSLERTQVTVTISARALTASSTISDKTYDGSAVTGTVNLGTVSNLVLGESLTITPTAAVFDNANVADGKSTIISYALADGTGGLAANYSMASIAATGDINPLLLTINNPTLTLSKVYDGNTTASVTANAFTNKIGSDDVTINTAIANYDTKNVGTGKTITVAYTIAGDDAGNYIAPVNFTADDGVINALQLTIADPTITKTKVYDGNTTAVVTAGALANIVGSDDVSIATTMATYDNANVGTGKTITVVYTIGGTAAGNYIAPVNFTADDGVINALQLTIADPTITKTKVYDGNTTASVTAGALANIVGSDDVSIATTTATYNDAIVGTGKTLTVVYTIDGGDADNYIAPVNFTANDGVITKLQLTIADPTITKTKVYDGNTTASVTAGALANIVGSDDVSIATTTATYNDANVGESKTITVVYTIEGTAAGNYTAPVNFTADDGVITALQLTINNPTLTLSKVYDGNTTASVTANAFTNKIGSDDVTINTAIANYDTKNVGTGKTITVVYSITGTAAGNYTKPVDYVVNTGEITAAPLTAATTVASKGYDGTAATGTVTLGDISGYVGGETLTITPTATNYSDANVGTAKATTISYALADGTNGGVASNYSMANLSTSGNITAVTLTVTANDIIRGVGKSTPAFTYIMSGFVNLETEAGLRTASALSGTVTFTDSNGGSTNAGSYAVTPVVSGLTATNYNFSAATGALSIVNVIIEATGGTARAGYSTLAAAYTAINSGTHQGVITVNIYANTIETTTATLNQSGEGAASYSSVSIVPQAPVTITGNTGVSPVIILGNSEEPL